MDARKRAYGGNPGPQAGDERRGPSPGGLGCCRRRRYQRTIMRDLIRILGIDPGLRRTGWGVVALDGNRLSFLACGSLATGEEGGRGAPILGTHDGVLHGVDQHAPHEAAVEATFVNKDAAATLKLGQARGIAMLVPAIAALPDAEYAPTLVN